MRTVAAASASAGSGPRRRYSAREWNGVIVARRLGVIAALLAAYAGPVLPAHATTAPEAARFAAAVDAIARRPQLAHAIVAAEVFDLDAGQPVFERNGTVLMEAASTTKLVTTGTALALLGPGFRFTTPVYRRGAIDRAGVLHGDVVLVASGDPNLSQRIRSDGSLAFENEDHSYGGSYDTAAVPGDPLAVLRDLAAQVARAGVKRVDGSVVIDTSLLADQGPESGTGAVVSPIVVNDNLVDVLVTPGRSAGDPVSVAVSPVTPYLTFVNHGTTEAKGMLPTLSPSGDVVNSDGSHVVTLTGALPAGPPLLVGYRVSEPATFARYAFTQALADAGVAVERPRSAAAVPRPLQAFDRSDLLAEHVSPPLSQDVYVTLKVSQNLHAALMPYMWALYKGHVTHDVLATAFSQERALLASAGLDLRQAAQEDGLGGSAFFTPDFMVRYLAWARRQSWFAALRHGLPVLGVDGTLYDIATSLPGRGKVFAKTGTWDSDNSLDGNALYTKGLAGYTTSRHGRHLAFAFYINRMAGKFDLDPAKDGGHYAGQALGLMASDAYSML